MKHGLAWSGWWAGLFLSLSPAFSSPLPVDPSVRLRLARIYAPEIRTDANERYGLASPAYFISKSFLMANISDCPIAEKRGILKAPLGEGSLFLVRDRMVWNNTKKSCTRVYYPFVPGTVGGKEDRASPGHLFLQLKARTDDILLRDEARFDAIPEINVHVQRYRHERCLQKGRLRGCKRSQTKDFYLIQYFVFLMYNDACNLHEGEQEGMIVVIDAEAFEKAKTAQEMRAAVYRVGFYQHYKTKVVKPEAAEWADITHPVGFMGAGGHGTYPTSGKTALLPGFPLGSRNVIQKICENRRRLDRLTEYHRGNGVRYRTWLPFGHPQALEIPSGAEVSPASKPTTLKVASSRPTPKAGFVKRTLRRSRDLAVRTVIRAGRSVIRSKAPIATTDVFLSPETPEEKKLLASIPALQDRCLFSQGRPGVRLCDVMGHPQNDPCCFQDRYIGPYPRWIAFAGRWGEQELFSAKMQDKSLSWSLMSKLPLGHSFGDSGPFGPKFIHQTTWTWDGKRFPDRPRSTPAPWR